MAAIDMLDDDDDRCPRCFAPDPADHFYEDDPADAPEPCPMGCGRTTSDPGGGQCDACWDFLYDRDDER